MQNTLFKTEGKERKKQWEKQIKDKYQCVVWLLSGGEMARAENGGDDAGESDRGEKTKRSGGADETGRWKGEKETKSGKRKGWSEIF